MTKEHDHICDNMSRRQIESSVCGTQQNQNVNIQAGNDIVKKLVEISFIVALTLGRKQRI